jgi:hypothetical protein
MPGPLDSRRYALIWLVASSASWMGMQKLPHRLRSAEEVSPVFAPRMPKLQTAGKPNTSL